MKTTPPLPKARRYEQGASLVIVVLLAMIVLAGLVVMSSNLALSSYRTTSEQKAILPAQFAAESGVAYAKAKLSAAQALMTAQDGFVQGSSILTARNLIGRLCPTPANLPSTAARQQTTVPGTQVVIPDSVVICTIPSLSSTQAALLTNIMNGGANTAATFNQYGISPSQREQFFTDLFAYNTDVSFGDAKIQSGLQPLALLQTGLDQYQFFFKVAGLTSTGSSDGSARKIQVEGNSTIHSMTISLVEDVTLVPTAPISVINKSFASYGLFINRGSNGGYYGAENYFSGPVHTNTIMSFGYTSGRDENGNLTADGRGQTIIMDGNFTSSGCAEVRYDASIGKDSCIGGATNQLYDATAGQTKTGDTMKLSGATSQHVAPNENTAGTYNDYGDSVFKMSVKKGNNAPQFGVPFVTMPKNAQDQKSLANTDGISMSGDVAQVKLTAGADKYQYISIAKTAADVANPVQFRYKPSTDTPPKMYMQMRTSTGAWVAARKAGPTETTNTLGWVAVRPGEAPGTFGGVVYTDGNVTSLSGPPRNAAGDATATGGAAISSFAGLTVAAEKNVTLTGDVKYETRCLSPNACVDANGNPTVDNMFGVFSGSGNIRVAWDPYNLNQVIDPNGILSAPQDIQIDGFLMASKDTATGADSGQIKPWNTRNNTAFSYIKSAAGKKGKFNVHGGTIKDADAYFGYVNSVGANILGWSENYMYDNRGQKKSPPGFPTTSVTVTQVPGEPTPVPNGKIKDYNFGVQKYNPNNSVACSATTNCIGFSLENEIRQGTLN